MKNYNLKKFFQTFFLPIIVAIFNVEEGESINNQEIGLKENFRLKGLNNSLFHQITNFIMKYNISIRRIIKKICPPNYIREKQIKNRLKDGWVINVNSDY